jgi:hypothetical protein
LQHHKIKDLVGQNFSGSIASYHIAYPQAALGAAFAFPRAC